LFYRRHPALALAALIALAVCAQAFGDSAKAPQGKQRRLAGNWSGSYQTSDGERCGIIDLATASEEAETSGTLTISASTDPAGRPRWTGPLTLESLRIQGDSVFGTLTPFRDPDCGCLLSITFTGHVEGETISGVFLASGEGMHPPQLGSWTIARASR
jgi:hypothetical protein